MTVADLIKRLKELDQSLIVFSYLVGNKEGNFGYRRKQGWVMFQYEHIKTRKIGRPRKVDFKEVKRLRLLGKSIRKISSELGCSQGSVQNALRVVEKLK